jgi:hypothetical protein
MQGVHIVHKVCDRQILDLTQRISGGIMGNLDQVLQGVHRVKNRLSVERSGL